MSNPDGGATQELVRTSDASTARGAANNGPAAPAGSGLDELGAGTLRSAGWAGLAALALSACGGGGAATAPAAATPPPAPTPAPTPAPSPAPTPAPSPAPTPPPTAISDEQAARFLLQAQFSASDADIAAVRSQGYAAWLDAQMSKPAGPTAFDWLAARGYNDANVNTQYFNATYPADFALWNQLFTAPDPVRKRMALALSEIMVVSTSGLNVSWRSQMAAAYWDLLNAHAFGNFRDLLEAVTLSPAMGVFLNTRGNQKEDPATGRQPDENYAREVMQLFTIGLYELNADGSVKTDAGGQRIETYGNADVTNLARVFTGWDLNGTSQPPVTVQGDTRTLAHPDIARLPMRFIASRHSTQEVNFLGLRIPANTDGTQALRQALDHLFKHANVGPFIGRQLIQRLVTSEPSPAYVARVAAVFANDGQGVRGNLRAVLRAVLLDDEARGAAGLRDPLYGKLREPMLRFIQWGRTFGISSARGSWKIGDLSNPATQLGQSPLRAASVFNFFRPGYVPPSTALSAAGRVAPEFQIVNESSVAGYLNFMTNAIRNGIFVNGPDQPQAGSTANNGYDIRCSYAELMPLVADARALVDKICLLLAAGQVAQATRQLMVAALQSTPVDAASSEAAKLDRIAGAVLMVMACPEFLVQK
jgi:uncharacterized protein (DUF1800 family)